MYDSLCSSQVHHGIEDRMSLSTNETPESGRASVAGPAKRSSVKRRKAVAVGKDAVDLIYMSHARAALEISERCGLTHVYFASTKLLDQQATNLRTFRRESSMMSRYPNGEAIGMATVFANAENPHRGHAMEKLASYRKVSMRGERVRGNNNNVLLCNKRFYVSQGLFLLSINLLSILL